MSIASYSSSSYATDAIRNNALDEVHANAIVSAHNLSEMLKIKIESVVTNLRIISNAPIIQAQQVPQGQVLFEGAQASTEDITDSYLWLDRDGKLLWSSSFPNQSQGSDSGCMSQKI